MNKKVNYKISLININSRETLHPMTLSFTIFNYFKYIIIEVRIELISQLNIFFYKIQYLLIILN